MNPNNERTITVTKEVRGMNAQYLETRYYDNGKAFARLTDEEPPEEYDSDKYDRYIEIIGSDGDYESLGDWFEENCIETDDIIPMVIALESGKAVNISQYI